MLSLNGLTSCRKRKYALPPFNLKNIAEYTDLDGNARSGIRWGLRDIWDIFEPLGDVGELVTIAVRVSF